MLLTLKVATLTKSLSVPVPLGAPRKKGATEFVVPAGIILPGKEMANPELERLIFLLIAYFLFRPEARTYFRHRETMGV